MPDTDCVDAYVHISQGYLVSQPKPVTDISVVYRRISLGYLVSLLMPDTGCRRQYRHHSWVLTPDTGTPVVYKCLCERQSGVFGQTVDSRYRHNSGV